MIYDYFQGKGKVGYRKCRGKSSGKARWSNDNHNDNDNNNYNDNDNENSDDNDKTNQMGIKPSDRKLIPWQNTLFCQYLRKYP